MINTIVPKQGEVYLVNFTGEGSVQRGTRPALIMQNNIGNAYSPNVIVYPFTTRYKKKYMPTHVLLPAKEVGLNKDSMVLCENPQTIPKENLGEFITTVPEEFLKPIAIAIQIAQGLLDFVA